MSESQPVAAPAPAANGHLKAEKPRRFPLRLIIAALGVCLCFSVPLYRLVHFALESELYSYVILVPFVSVYLFATNVRQRSVAEGNNRAAAVVLIGVGLALLAGYWSVLLSGAKLAEQNSLALSISSFVFLLVGACALVLDGSTLRGAAFPLAFLVFMVPFPSRLEHVVETFLQHGSAPVAHLLFKAVGTPVFFHNLTFQLPGISLHVAPECSGIRSTLALFMTSLVAGYFFLRSPRTRAILALAVIPLALLRNGFRIFTIGELCVQISPEMIESSIHHRGGPIFFALSLIPFLVLLYFLLRWDRKQTKLHPTGSSASI
jgi:exosortase C (VPDSG-CTERM-specific)